MEMPLSHDPQLVDYIQWAFLTLLSFYGWQVTAALKDLRESVSLLNERVAVVVARIDVHEKRLDKHEVQIDEIQQT